MNIILKTQDTTIIKAVELVKKYCDHPDFLLEIVRHGRFNECHLFGWPLVKQVVIGFDGLDITVKEYRTWNPWSKTIAYASGKTIYFNTRKSFPLLDRVETTWHELSHLAGFKHRGNKNNEYNRGTLPYLGAKLFRAFVEQQEKRKEVA